jgi:putative Mg2+ transporter-C (MgtC) family protein
MENAMPLEQILMRLGLALVLGAIIGAEREWRQKTAGIRTNALVAAGAALFIMLGAIIQNDTSPTRIAGQIVTGIGFLGAGVMMRDGLNVRGLNTAATLWCVQQSGLSQVRGCYCMLSLVPWLSWGLI